MTHKHNCVYLLTAKGETWILPVEGTQGSSAGHAMMMMSLKKVTLLGSSNLASVMDFNRIETPHSLCCDFGGYKTFTTRWSGGRVKVWGQIWAPIGHLVISLKAVPEGNQRFKGHNQLPSSWGSSQALLVLARWASTNTGCFQVGDSCRWPRLACMRKTCDTDSVQESPTF